MATGRLADLQTGSKGVTARNGKDKGAHKWAGYNGKIDAGVACRFIGAFFVNSMNSMYSAGLD